VDKKDGDYVERDEVIAELESEKATFEVNAEKAGVIKLEDIKEGDSIKIGINLQALMRKLRNLRMANLLRQKVREK
jgi:pyruvate/2-oxoglutarate dehydrogenase complex dihydrolipoamide acyltransferase (E2) component